MRSACHCNNTASNTKRICCPFFQMEYELEFSYTISPSSNTIHSNYRLYAFHVYRAKVC